MVSLIFAALFGQSLLPKSRPLCLRFAEKISDGIMPEGANVYCRRLTWVWFIVLLACGVQGAVLPLTFGREGVFVSMAISSLVVAACFIVESHVRRRCFSVVFHTSGSTSRPKTIVKSFESLAKEVALHREMLFDGPTALSRAGLVFLSTIEPEHMYGMLWRVMLPAAVGCCVDPEIILTPESLIAKMRAADKVFFVTTPSFLKRFCAYAEEYVVPQNCVEITTSGALLDAKTSAAAKRVFGVAPREIFGSTETGGVAWRRQNAAMPCDGYDWQVFVPVRIRNGNDGRIVVRSPFSFKRDFVMGDGAEISPDGRRFRLLGRMDRIVKISEQRVSLPEMEERMRKLEGINDVALLPVDGEKGTCLAAVIVPDVHSAYSPIGDDAHMELKGQALIALRKRLLPIFPKGAVPRRYRFVPELPRNAQGKLRISDLKKLFATSDSSRFEIEISFPANENFFKGHFPDHPVVPGVVLVGAAVTAAEKWLGRTIALKAMRKVKFSRALEPDETARLCLERKKEDEIGYFFVKEGMVCSSGLLVVR